MTNIENILSLIDQLRTNVLELREELTSIKSQAIVEPKKPSLSNNWPIAVDPEMICITDEDKLDRARNIFDILISEPYAGKTFLDYGCGEGYLVQAASEQGCITTGFDIKSNDSKPWKEIPNSFTTNFEDIQNKGQYDIIVLYDVLDHVESESPIDVLSKVRTLCHEKTKIFVRCHPWISRHGSHEYHENNHAFYHLLAGKPAPENAPVYPKTTYAKWFASAGFNILFRQIDRQKVEDLVWTNPDLQESLKKLYPDSNNRFFAWVQLEQSFHDYILMVGTPASGKVSSVSEVVRIGHTVNNNNIGTLLLLDNGRINNQNDRNQWIIQDDKLLLKWPRNDAPSGVWVDRVAFAPDRLSYSGSNQIDHKVKGVILQD